MADIIQSVWCRNRNPFTFHFFHKYLHQTNWLLLPENFLRPYTGQRRLSVPMLTIFLRYTACPKCSHLYPVESCKVQLAGSIVSKLCDHVEFPEHPHFTQRQPCATVLMKKVKTFVGTTVLYPHNLFCYKDIIESLQAFSTSPRFYSKMWAMATKASFGWRSSLGRLRTAIYIAPTE